MSTELHPSIVALVSLAANIAANHPKQGLCQVDRLKGYGVSREQIDAVVLMFSGDKDEIIIVTFPSGTAIEAEVADTPEKQLFGLAFRESLPPDRGMLYIFDTSDRHRVRTNGFLFPVDVIWADASRHVVHLVERAQPCEKDPCPAYGPPPENGRYVIETEAGFIAREKLSTGVELKFTLVL